VSAVLKYETETVERVRAVKNRRLNRLSGAQVRRLYRTFSHECYCAGWMDPRPDVVKQFVEWATTAPCDWENAHR
jgi:hypothetical protein